MAGTPPRTRLEDPPQAFEKARIPPGFGPSGAAAPATTKRDRARNMAPKALVSPAQAQNGGRASLGRRGPETVDAAEIRGVDDLALAIYDQPALERGAHRGPAHVGEVRPPAEFVFAADLSESLGRIGRTDRPSGGSAGAEFGDERVEGGGIGHRHGADVVDRRRAVKFTVVRLPSGGPGG